MYCLTTRDEDLEMIKSLEYLPVGLGDKIKSDGFIKDSSKVNISKKNNYYGEYTFHFWLWKNYLDNLEDGWIGFCQYRKFWSNENCDTRNISLDVFKKTILKNISEQENKFESIIGTPMYINQFKLTKFLKKDFFSLIKKPSLIFDKNKRNIKFHFDLMHGKGNLEKAINLLDQNDKKDFSEFVNSEVSFNPHNMFICRSKKILNNYYKSIFPWLERCEKEFGFNLESYGLKRIYGFLAERYMSYWFRKYTRHTVLPIIFKDLKDFKTY